MKVHALVVLGLIGCGSAGPAQRAGSTPVANTAKTPILTNDEILPIMERYLGTVFSGDVGDLERIRDFVTQSHDVNVVVDATVTPFLDDGLDEGVGNLLMIGFVAGDALAQLRAKVKRDEPLAGVEGELAIYMMLKALSTTKLKDAKVVSPHLDALLELRARGELRAYVARTGRVSGDVATGTSPGPAPSASELAASGTGSTASLSERAARDEESKQLIEAIHLVGSGRPQEAITDYLDKVLAALQARYATEKRHIYCAHSPAESLKYMLDATNHHEDALSLDSTWADAWYVKSYALTELHRDAEALSALEAAIALSPSYSQYLSERGNMYQQANDWKHALQTYEEAENAVKLISDQKVQVRDHTRALRGQGYALVELGDLAAAERKYRQSLALDPDDTKAKQELDYVNSLQVKRK
jgi:tetratricopeptide (TPR) repeat protein